MAEGDQTICRSPVGLLPLPDAPSGLMAQDAGVSVQLNWSDNNVDQKVSAYNVYRATAEGGPYSLLGSPTSSSYNDSSGTANTTYFYRITAVNASGESGYTITTGVRTADVTPPGVPVILSTTVTGPTSVTITWTPPTDTDLAGFFVYSRTGANAYVKISGTPPLAQPTFTDTGAVAGNTWDYHVSSVDTVGNESTNASTSIAVPAADTTPPAVPTGLAATDTGAAIQVVWNANTEPDLAGYFIYRSDDGFTASLTSGTLLTSPGYEDTTALQGTAYTYKVLAKDTTGNASAKSAASNSVTRPVSSNIGDLTPFVFAGSIVPCVVHARGVSKRGYSAKVNAAGDGLDVVLSDNNDFPALANGTQLTARYFFDFAAAAGQDPGTFQKTRGFNSAHVYDKAGTYTVRFVRTDEKGVKTELKYSHIAQPDSRSIVYCVASAGDSSSSNPGHNITKPVSFARGLALLNTSANLKLLLRNGDTFNIVGGEVNVSSFNQMLSNYSDPAKPSTVLPLINFSVAPTKFRWFITCQSKSRNFVVENVQVNRSYAGGDGVAIQDVFLGMLGPCNVLARNITFLRIGKPFTCSEVGSNGTESSSRFMLVQNCTWPNNDSLIYNMMFVEGSDYVFLGNKAVNSTQEHILRLSQVCRVFIDSNNFQNLQLSTSDIVKTTINAQHGSDFYISRNVLTARQGTAGTCQLGPLVGNGAVAHFSQWTVCERNTIFSSVDVIDGALDVMIRFNVINNDGNNGIYVHVKGSGLDAFGKSYTARASQRVYIYGNTIVNNAKSGELIKVSTHIDTLKIWSNLLIAPNFPAIGAGGLNPSPSVLYFPGGINTSLESVSWNLFPKCDGFCVSSTNMSLTRFQQLDATWVNVADNPVLNMAFKYPASNANKAFARWLPGMNEDFYGTDIPINSATLIPGAVQSTY